MPRDEPTPAPEAPGLPNWPEYPVVGWLAPDGTLTVADCVTCPYRGQLCDVCVVPELEATGLADYGPGTSPPPDIS